MLMRTSLLLSIVAMAAMLSGCCCGPGAGACGSCPGECNNCDDAGYGRLPTAYGPLDSLTQMRKSLVCGGGCGEAYYGEWTSTPPDACDPCCGSQFVGGATPCVPFCWRPGYFFGFLGGIYGQRYCDGCGNDVGHCGCGSGWVGGDTGCGGGSCGCGDGSYSDYGGGGAITGGCSTCSAGHSSPNRTSNVPRVDTNHRSARANAIRHGMSSSRSNSGTTYR